MRRKVIPYHLAALHHEPNALELCNVRDRITGDGDEVGEFPGLHPAHAVLPAQHFCGVRRDRTLYPNQSPSEQRALLRTIIDTATWKDGTLTVTYRAPFDALSNLTTRDASTGKAGLWPSHQEWPARGDSNSRPTA
jgi:hypothetical protein